MATDPLSSQLRLLVGAVLASSLSSCGGDVAACRERVPVLPAGVFGCVTASDDVGGASVEPLPKFAVEVFPSMPPPTPSDGLSPLAQATSDAIGYYQLALPAGTYAICTSFRRCLELTVPASTRVALDYDFGVGNGWSPR